MNRDEKHEIRPIGGAPGELGVPRHLQEEARDYLRGTLSENTHRAYASDWRGFLDFCEREDLVPLPAGAGTVVAYATWLARSHPWATITRKLAAIGKTHVLAGHPSPRDEPVVREACRGIRRRIGTAPRHARRPLLREDIGKLAATCPEETPAGKRDRAIILLGFACAFRRSELAELDLSALAWEARGVRVRVARSKRDQEGKGEVIGVPAEAGKTLDALRAWVDARPAGEGPLFCAFSPGGVPKPRRISPRDVGRVVARALHRAGIQARAPRSRKPAGSKREVKAFGAHSLRAGFVTQARLDGRSIDEIMSQTRHKSERVVRGYVRDVDALGPLNAARGVAL